MTGRLILAGDGNGANSRLVDGQFAAWIENGKLLYLPMTAELDNYQPYLMYTRQHLEVL